MVTMVAVHVKKSVSQCATGKGIFVFGTATDQLGNVRNLCSLDLYIRRIYQLIVVVNMPCPLGVGVSRRHDLYVGNRPYILGNQAASTNSIVG